MNDTYRASLSCDNCGHGWLMEVEMGRKVFGHCCGATVVDDSCYCASAKIYQESIMCPQCGCKSGVKRG